MAFWKMEGFEVTPTTPSSTILCNAPPSTRSSRLMESIQIPCPNCAAFSRFSFISCLLVRESGWAPRPFAAVARKTGSADSLGVPLRRAGVLDGGRAFLFGNALRAPQEVQGLVGHVLRAYPELLQQFLARRRGPVAVDPDAPAAEADVALPAGSHPGLDRDARLDRRRQDRVPVAFILGVVDLPRGHAHHAGVPPPLGEQPSRFERHGDLRAGPYEDD